MQLFCCLSLLSLALGAFALPKFSGAKEQNEGININSGFGFNLNLAKELLKGGNIKSGSDGDDSDNPILMGAAGPSAIVPLVYTDLGGLLGKADISRNGRYFYGFLGIPYAQNVTKFEPSAPVKAWGNIRDARASGPMCLQPGGPNGVQGEEQCLFLDVYHPHEDYCKNASDSGKLPVIVNIHGGGFTGGAGSYFVPKYFMDECVTYVTINYRLGALGFLTTEDSVIPGNLGLKDQITALQWVQKYIEEFRGDKNLVTVVGISAGGSSVSHLVVSPMAKGLIHRGIAMSGNVLNPWSIAENPTQVAQNIAKQLNCPVDTTQNMRKCLEGKDAKDITAQQGAGGGLIPLAPVIEAKTAKNPFLTENPAVLYRKGIFNRIPLMAGFVEDEGIGLLAGVILQSPDLTALVNNNFNMLAPSLFLYDQLGFSEEKKNDISTKIRQFYFGDKAISQETRQNLTDLYSDRLFVQGTFETVEAHSKYAKAYPYVMSYKGGYSGAWGLGYQIPAITHGDDGQFLFPSTPIAVGTEQYDFSTSLVKYWTSFAKTGAPSDSGRIANSWKASAGRSNQQWYQLNVPHKNLYNYLDDRRNFWQNVGVYEREMY